MVDTAAQVNHVQLIILLVEGFFLAAVASLFMWGAATQVRAPTHVSHHEHGRWVKGMVPNPPYMHSSILSLFMCGATMQVR